MNTQDITKTLAELRKEKKRKFSQTFDLQIRFHNLDLKKQESKIDVFVALPSGKGKEVTVCGLVGGSLEKDAKTHCSHYILADDFKAYKGKKADVKKLVRSYDFFIAGADVMPAVATTFGRYFGPSGKMPNPKAGAIIPPKGNVKAVVERLQKTVRLQVKSELGVKCAVGTEAMTDEDIAANVMAVYSAVANALPQHDQNIHQASLKLSMSKAFTIGGRK